MPPPWQAAIPTHFQALAPEDLTPGRIARSRFYLYRQNLRLFPSFWGALWARIQLALLPAPPARPDGAGPVLLVRTAGGLLEPELARGLTALGRTVTALPAENTVTVLREILARETPALFLCVNGAGLDADGLCPALLAAAGVRLAVWFVDNPFHAHLLQGSPGKKHRPGQKTAAPREARFPAGQKGRRRRIAQGPHGQRRQDHRAQGETHAVKGQRPHAASPKL